MVYSRPHQRRGIARRRRQLATRIEAVTEADITHAVLQRDTFADFSAAQLTVWILLMFSTVGDRNHRLIGLTFTADTAS